MDLPGRTTKMHFRLNKTLPACFSLLLLSGVLSFAGQPVATAEARFSGDYGFRVLLTDLEPTYVQDDTPSQEIRYRARFYFRLSRLSMGEGETLVLFAAYQPSGIPELKITVLGSGGNKVMRFSVRLDNGTFLETPIGDAETIPDGWHAVEIDWRAANGTGSLEAWLDGAAAGLFGGLANGNGRIDTVRLGAVEGRAGNTSGHLDFDVFDSKRLSELGLVCFSSSEIGAAFVLWPVSRSVRDIINMINHPCP